MDKTFRPAEVEAKHYARWEEAGAFAAHVDSSAPPYSIMMPPPNVTGSLHMGHALTITMQDILIRYHRMRGFDALWQPGTDHAGIATQMVVERQLAAKGVVLDRPGGRQAPGQRDHHRPRRLRREGLGVEGGIRRHHHAPAAPARRLARLAARALHHGRGPLARRAQGLRRSPQAGPDLSRQAAGELGPQAADGDLRSRGAEPRGEGPSLAHPLSDRGRARSPHRHRHHAAGDDAGRHRRRRASGRRALQGPRRQDTSLLPLVGRQIPIIADDYADPENGTGAVKITPAHDFNDFEVGRRHDLPRINIFDRFAGINENAPEAYRGLDRFEARKRVVADLEAQGLSRRSRTIPTRCRTATAATSRSSPG